MGSISPDWQFAFDEENVSATTRPKGISQGDDVLR